MGGARTAEREGRGAPDWAGRREWAGWAAAEEKKRRKRREKEIGPVWAVGRKRKDKGKEGESWAGLKTKRENEKLF